MRAALFCSFSNFRETELVCVRQYLLSLIKLRRIIDIALSVDASLTVDEVHFLFRCPTYSMIRNNFYNKIKTLIPNITQLPVNVLINELMNSSNYFINIQFIKYISACFDVRDKLLPK